MAAFGVPVEFPALELYELYHAGGGLACAEVLKCSQLFVKKMRGEGRMRSRLRDADYDFSMGACLHALHSACPGYIAESTAADIVSVFPRAVQTSRSSEHQVAMCNAYKRIVELCSPRVWKPEILLKLCMTRRSYHSLVLSVLS